METPALIDIKAEIARIDRQREETQEFTERQGEKDLWILAFAALIAAFAAIIARLPELLAAFGLPH